VTEELKKYAHDLPAHLTGGERRDRTWFDELSEELERHANRIEERLHRFFSRALIAFAVLGIASAVGLLGFGIVLKKQARVSQQIQQQRFEVQVENCVQQNIRHDNVIAKIDQAVAATPKKDKAQAEKSAGPFKLILEAAVPYTEDCVAVARSRVRGS
jgi:hypothetical protein